MSGQAHQPPSAFSPRLRERILSAARGAAEAERWDEASDWASELVAIDPDDAEARRLLDQAKAGGVRSQGQRAMVSLIFCDLVDSTPMAEKVDPEVILEVWSTFRDIAATAVQHFGGTVQRSEGDGVIAVFGYWNPAGDDARNAVGAALMMARDMERARPSFQEQFGVDVQARVAVHTGLVVIADIAAGTSIERDALVGPAPNVADRLQKEAPRGGVVMGDVTAEMVDGDFDARSLGLRDLKGIDRPVEVFQVLSRSDVTNRLAGPRYHRGRLEGRDRELNQLLDAWNGLDDPAAILLTGEAGFGKSRLLAEFRTAVENEGGFVAETACLADYATAPLWPMARLLERLSGSGRGQGQDERRRRLNDFITDLGQDPEEVGPKLAPFFGLHPSAISTADPAVLLGEVLDHILAMARHRSSQGAWVLAIEDIQWSDPTTLRLLTLLAEDPVEELLVVATSRPVEPAEASPETRRIGELFANVELSSVDREAGARIARAAAPEPLADDVIRDILNRADGVPLFIEELANRKPDVSAQPQSMSARLQELLTARIRSSGVDLQLLQIASSIGPTFDAGLLGDIVDDDLIRARLDQLVDLGVLVPSGTDDYRFRHVLLQDATYETQLLSARAAVHGRIADAMATLEPPVPPAVLARQLELAERPADALQHYATAGANAAMTGAYAEAHDLFTTAISLLDAIETPEVQVGTEIELRLRRVQTLTARGGYGDPIAAVDIGRVVNLCAEHPALPGATAALIALWALDFVQGNLVRSRATIELVDRAAPTSIESDYRPEIDVSLGYQTFYEGRLTEALSHFQRSVDGFERRDPAAAPPNLQPNDPHAVALVGLCCMYWLADDPAAALLAEEQAMARLTEIDNHAFTSAFVFVYLAWTRSLQGQRAEASDLGRRARTIAAEAKLPYLEQLGSRFVFDEPSPVTLELVDAICAQLDAVGHQAFRATYLSDCAEQIGSAGDVDAAEQLYERAFETMTATGESVHLPSVHLSRAAVRLAARAEPELVIEDLERAAKTAQHSGARVLARRAKHELETLPEGYDGPARQAALDRLAAGTAVPPTSESAPPS